VGCVAGLKAARTRLMTVARGLLVLVLLILLFLTLNTWIGGGRDRNR